MCRVFERVKDGVHQLGRCQPGRIFGLTAYQLAEVVDVGSQQGAQTQIVRAVHAFFGTHIRFGVDASEVKQRVLIVSAIVRFRLDCMSKGGEEAWDKLTL